MPPFLAMTAPPWVRDAVFYQIFPDRFANGDPTNDPPDVQPWGSRPTTVGFQGGDLNGIREHLDHLETLGVNALYLNPIFQAASNHRYDTTDYRVIDDRLGSHEDFLRFLRAAHDRGIRVLLDGVFNHSGRGFFAFRDLLERGPASEYRDWYHVHAFPLDAFGRGKARRYEAWWGFRNLPKLNIANPELRRYLLETARSWIGEGADGWRLDVPNEIADDSFWAQLRDVVKSENPEAFLLGEIWAVDPRWVGPSAFDGLMNYPLRQALLDLVVRRSLPPSAFRAHVESQIASYARDSLLAHYNLLGSHDTPRVATLARGNARRLRILFTLQFCLPGAPGIYYGDEIGLRGGKDPGCRRAFDWDEAHWDSARLDLVKTLIHLRRSRPELRHGEVRFLTADDGSRTMAMARSAPEGATVVAVNLSEERRSLDLDVAPLGWTGRVRLAEGLSGEAPSVEGGILRLALAPLDCRLIYDGGRAPGGDV